MGEIGAYCRRGSIRAGRSLKGTTFRIEAPEYGTPHPDHLVAKVGVAESILFPEAPPAFNRDGTRRMPIPGDYPGEFRTI
jgi:hypothetical protein